MKKNEIYEAEIISLSGEGAGVCRIDGKVVFLPFAAVGDVCEIKILKSMESYAYGKIQKFITKSPDRIEPDCPVYGKCGGCVFRHISYQAELKVKESWVKETFKRIGGLEPEFLPIIPSEDILRYRNKAQYPLGRDKEGKAQYGFYAKNSHRIVPWGDCLLQPELFNEIAAFIMDIVRTRHISVYDEEKHQGVFRHICIRQGHHTGEVNVTLVAKRRTPELIQLGKTLPSRFPEIKGVTLNINKEDTNVILGDMEETVWGQPYINDKICGVDLRISPRSFYQVNTPMAEKLYRLAADFARPEGKLVLDLYCGTGAIGLSMADKADKIIGVEISQTAVENAKENAALNGFNNTEFYAGDTGEITKMLLSKGIKPDIITLDPARKGCDKLALDNIIAFSPDTVVMISCNPATAARDCKYLCERGYRAAKAGVVDMFPRTGNVETVVLLSKGL